MLSKSVQFIVFLTLMIGPACNLQAVGCNQLRFQNDTALADSTGNIADNNFLISNLADSLIVPDTLQSGSLSTDSLDNKQAKRESQLNDKVIYSAKDSMRISLSGKILYLYGEANVKYTNIELSAEIIELNLASEEVFAKGSYDSLGVAKGTPIFKQGAEEFKSDSLRYNFSSRKGIIYHIISQQGEGYLHSSKTKRQDNGQVHMQGGKYTTCDAPHPHFFLALNKAIVIPNEKILTKSAYLVVEDVPIKALFIPFGFFPISNKSSTGLLFPTWGDEVARGFFLREGGWYQVLGDHADWKILGDYYTKGSFALRNSIAYKWRYKFSGNLGFDYALTRDKDFESIPTTKDYKIRWSHSQDSKANPTRNFSASVNFSSSGYDKKQSYDRVSRMNNNTTSSISYTKRWPGSPFNLALSANANQNLQTGKTDINLPTGSLNMGSIYPFRSKAGIGSKKFYENISLTYSSNFYNSVSTNDSLMFKKEMWDKLENGFKHNIPLSVNFKVGKLITITPSMSYTGVIYNKSFRTDTTYISKVGKRTEIRDTLPGFQYAHAINPSIGISFAPKIYGMYQSKRANGYVEAVRHVMSPSASFRFVPDVSSLFDSQYKRATVVNLKNDSVYLGEKYNIFTGMGLYSPPTVSGRSGTIGLDLSNNLEMKVRPKNDTTGKGKKIPLIDNLYFSTSYNPFAKKVDGRWSSVSASASTSLFNGKMNISSNARFDPYAVNDDGTYKIDWDSTTQTGTKVFQYMDKPGKLLRFESISLSTGFSLKSKQKDKKKDEGESADGGEAGQNGLDNSYMDGEMEYQPGNFTRSYVDFDVPWSLNFQYSWSFNKNGSQAIRSNILNVNGDFSLTPKWKIGMSSGYDFEYKKASSTNISIYRDLHCWEMAFTVVPFGNYKSYTFKINAKSSLLQDLKYDKKPNWYDNF